MYKIGVYDRYLSTAGGGERYSCKIAEILSKDKKYKVDLLTDLHTDLDLVSKRLNLDLKNVNLKIFPFLSDDYSKRITQNYDIFINATYLSSLPAAAKRNIYLCYFPTPFDVDFKIVHKLLLAFFRIPATKLFKLAEKINNDFANIEVLEGVYDVKRFMLRRGSFTSGKALILYKYLYKYNNTYNKYNKNNKYNKKYSKFSDASIIIGLKNPKSLGVNQIKCKISLYKEINLNKEIKKNIENIEDIKNIGNIKDIGNIEEDKNKKNNKNNIIDRFQLIFSQDLIVHKGQKQIIDLSKILSQINKNLTISNIVNISDDAKTKDIKKTKDITKTEDVTKTEGDIKTKGAAETKDSAKIDKAQSNFLVTVESDVFSVNKEKKGQVDSRKLGIVIYNEQKISFFKKLILKVLGFIPLFLITYPKNLNFLQTYHKIISISEYSYYWIKKLWKKESDILYPPVEVESFEPSKKENIILSVGRFFPEHHNKKQLEMAQVFIEMYKENAELLKDYKLILAGGVENKKEHLEYIEKIKKVCDGYPVDVLTNIKWNDLKELFSKSFIFWHAAGMGEDENKSPEKFEHFGITTVEAMASGCICIVINKGGQPEIIQNGINGFLFDSWEQLKKITLDVCLGKVDVKMITENALLRAKDFSSENFKSKLINIIESELERIKSKKH